MGIFTMKHCMAILSLLLLAACGTPSNHNPERIVKNGSPCPKAGMVARDTDGDVTRCVEVQQ
jgi:hypothetical protein